MANDYITKEAASDNLYKLPCKIDEDGYRWVLSRDVAHMIDETPAADVRPVVRGKWKTRKNWSRCVCSVCSWESGNAYNFCPNCGAIMREVNRGEK